MLIILEHLGYDTDENFDNDDVGPALMTIFPGITSTIVDIIFKIAFWTDEPDTELRQEALTEALMELARACERYPDMNN